MVEEIWQEYGLNRSLAALGLPKSTWYYHQQAKQTLTERYAEVKPQIEAIIEEHAEYGRKRIQVELREAYDVRLNHKVIAKLLRHWDLAQHRCVRQTAPSALQQGIATAGSSANLVQSLECIGIGEVLYTDFTRIPYHGGRQTAILMPIIGHTSKGIFGWALRRSRSTEQALAAWANAKATLQGYGLPVERCIVHQDQDSVYTSNQWADQLLRQDDVRLSYATNGAKGNPAMESFNGHFKGPLTSEFHEATSLEALRGVIQDRVRYWNRERRHSSLDYQAPAAYLAEQGYDYATS
jgi:putative transposase